MTTIAHGGKGIGRLNGKVVFIPYVIPGEEVVCRITWEKRNWAQAELIEVITPSPYRVAPTCDLFTRCGGCHFQHVTLEMEQKIKLELLTQMVKKRLKRPLTPVAIPVDDTLGLGYRARARLYPANSSGLTGLGFFKAGTNKVMEIPGCPVMVRELNRLLERVAETGTRWSSLNMEALQMESGTRADTRIILYIDRGNRPLNGELAKRFQDLSIPIFTCNSNGNIQLLSQRTNGSPLCFYQGPLAPEGLFCPPGGFFQANTRLNPKLIAKVLELANQSGPEKILELFCGCGNFSIPLAHAGHHVTAIEVQGSALDMAKRNAELNRCQDRMRFLQADLEFQYSWLNLKGDKFDLVLLDPPRTGAKNVCKMMGHINPRHIIYVSCDPMTLVRDLSTLEELGYHLEGLLFLNMFPRTFHFETICLLERH